MRAWVKTDTAYTGILQTKQNEALGGRGGGDMLEAFCSTNVKKLAAELLNNTALAEHEAPRLLTGSI